MKIEMGESLMLSWLKHAKECKITQLNWKASNNWSLYNENDANNLFNKMKVHFPVFKNSDFDQLIKQAEIDVLGVSLDDAINPYYYAIDIAYHENGLSYGSKEETIERISKKLLRSALILLIYFNAKNAEIIFTSPKINPAIHNDLNAQIMSINNFMIEQRVHYTFRLIANKEFNEYVLKPIIELSSTIADTSELFMRAFQLSSLCDKTSKQPTDILNNKINNSLSEFKIGTTVQTKIGYLFNNKFLTSKGIEQLKDEKYCKKTFNLNYPLLRDISEGRVDAKGYGRYWNRVFDNKYYVCSQWYENQRDNFENWYNHIINNVCV